MPSHLFAFSIAGVCWSHHCPVAARRVGLLGKSSIEKIRNVFWLNVFKINLKLYVYFSILNNFIFGDILLSRSQIFIDGCNPKDNIEKYVKNNIDNLSKMVPSYCSCLHKINWKKLFLNLSKSKNLIWQLCAAMMSWVGCLRTESVLPDTWKLREWE